MIVTKGVRTANETVKPIVMTDSMAYVRSNIVAIDEPETEDTPGFKGFIYDEIEYTKDEYIMIMANQVNDNNVLLATMLGGAQNE